MKLCKNQHFIHYAILAGLAFSAIILYANTMPFIIENQLHLGPSASGICLLLGALGICVGSFVSSKIVARTGSAKLIYIGLSLYCSMGLILLFTYYFIGTSLYSLLPCLFFITIGCGFIFPNALTLSFASIQSHIGIAGAIYGSLQTALSMLVNLFLNNLSTQNQMLLGSLYLIIGLIGLSLSASKRSHFRPMLISAKVCDHE